MPTQIEKYYCIIEYNNISLTNIAAHIKEFDTLEAALEFPLSEIIITKKQLPSKNAKGTNFILPYVYKYEILDKDCKPYFLAYKQSISTDYIIETERSGYAADTGGADISIRDRNNELASIRLTAGHDIKIGVVNSLIEFLINFDEIYSSDWKFYFENKKLEEKISELENELSVYKTLSEDYKNELELYKNNEKGIAGS